MLRKIARDTETFRFEMRNCLDFQIEDVLLTIHAALNDLRNISTLFLRTRKLLFA